MADVVAFDDFDNIRQYNNVYETLANYKIHTIQFYEHSMELVFLSPPSLHLIQGLIMTHAAINILPFMHT
eukprot:CAMPEP_0170551410 /NCGR_PEP_ID=MMETSP0211-20121228/9401_1 /TAXON_ID=311385 /ORGANISM="Pseudokeronopsis sp., Strain OXSARD2" /LENGTH=69 /DNA_ID=CAMNT_0010858543 /DNA_START=495 /DNA_END=704 /DNA_ORIENTATION=+